MTSGRVKVIDMETGEVIETRPGFQILPGPPGTCPRCAAEHEPHEPHNRDSLYYIFNFHEENGRVPTWSDAMAHCDKVMQDLFKSELRKYLEEQGAPIPEDLV